MTKSILDDWVNPHREYERALENLKRETDFMFDGKGSFILPIYGESGAGKSALFDDYQACYGSIHNKRGQSCIHRISMPTKQSGKSLPEKIFQSLNNNHSIKCGEAAMREKALTSILKSETRVLLVEEINNLVESKASKKALTNEVLHLTNWFKEIYDTRQVSVVMSGLPSIKILFQSNPQIERRSLRASEILAYKWSDPKDMVEFSNSVKACVKRFNDAGWVVEADANHVVRACYLASTGLFGIARDLFHGAEKLGSKDLHINTELLAMAFDRQSQREEFGNPFRLETISDEMLMLSYRHARERAHHFSNRASKGK